MHRKNVHINTGNGCRTNHGSVLMTAIVKVMVVALPVVTNSCSLREETAFDRVVEYYHQTGDTLKERAAEYLRDNARWHYGVDRHWTDSLGMYAHDLDYRNFATDTAFADYIEKNGYKFVEDSCVADVDTISEEFLRENIDLAFDSWRRPRAKEVPLSDFCRYILPYRATDEELSGWRRYFKEKYEAGIADSISDPSSIREAALYLMRRLKEEVLYSPPVGRLYRGRFMSHTEALRTHYMECAGLAEFGTLAMRACGIPCTVISISWRFNDVSHLTILLPETGSNKRACRLSVYDELIEMGEPKDSMASYRTWAYGFEPNPDLLGLSRDTDATPELYSPVTRHDVTGLISKTYDVSLPATPEMEGHGHAFLCRFSHWRWTPVREGVVDGDSVRFRNTTIRQWYRFGVMRGDSLYTFGNTFTILGPQVADSSRAAVPDTYSVQRYDCEGDTVFYKLVYNCEPDETRLTRDITAYYWGGSDGWRALRGEAALWGLNERTGEYRVFDDSMRGVFKPVFHLLQVRLPKWTVFYCDEFPRPLGFICTDPYSGEGYLMQF